MMMNMMDDKARMMKDKGDDDATFNLVVHKAVYIINWSISGSLFPKGSQTNKI